jgi:hypothetical protein
MNEHVAVEPETTLRREDIARAIYDVANRWIAPNFPKDHKLRTFDEIEGRDLALHLDYADAVLALARTPPQRPPLKLGDIVELNALCPYHDDYRGIELKLVSLSLGPDGQQWASVIEGNPRHRGHGVYDSETTGIRAEFLSPLSRPEKGDTP